jgi:hypothetical protein
MRSRFNHDQNTDFENFGSNLQNRSTLKSERPILVSNFLMWPRFDHGQNLDVKIFDAT